MSKSSVLQMVFVLMYILGHPEVFNGVQCVNCREWECCVDCYFEHKCPPHPKCRGRLAVYERIAPNTGLAQTKLDSTAAKLLRNIQTNPAYAVALTMAVLSGATILEEIKNDD
jgi:hypothetical protein